MITHSVFFSSGKVTVNAAKRKVFILINYLDPRVRGIKQELLFNFDASVGELNPFWLSPCD